MHAVTYPFINNQNSIVLNTAQQAGSSYATGRCWEKILNVVHSELGVENRTQRSHGHISSNISHSGKYNENVHSQIDTTNPHTFSRQL